MTESCEGGSDEGADLSCEWRFSGKAGKVLLLFIFAELFSTFILIEMAFSKYFQGRLFPPAVQVDVPGVLQSLQSADEAEGCAT